jgi:hypothetical protein
VPQVSWDGSQLTITADNSTLADILVAIRTRTGAEIDVSANASRERIAARLGPGPTREIIATLLSWTDFDYIIQASDNDPAGIHTPPVRANLNPVRATGNSDLNPPLGNSADERMQTLQGLHQQRRQMMQDARPQTAGKLKFSREPKPRVEARLINRCVL